jgi:hypothetical protein
MSQYIYVCACPCAAFLRTCVPVGVLVCHFCPYVHASLTLVIMFLSQWYISMCLCLFNGVWAYMLLCLHLPSYLCILVCGYTCLFICTCECVLVSGLPPSVNVFAYLCVCVSLHYTNHTRHCRVISIVKAIYQLLPEDKQAKICEAGLDFALLHPHEIIHLQYYHSLFIASYGSNSLWYSVHVK